MRIRKWLGRVEQDWDDGDEWREFGAGRRRGLWARRVNDAVQSGGLWLGLVAMGLGLLVLAMVWR